MHDLQSNLTRTVLVQQALDQESGQLSSNFNLLLMTWWPGCYLHQGRRSFSLVVAKGQQGRVDWNPATQSKCDLSSWVQQLVQPPQTSQSTVSHWVNLQGRVAQGSDCFLSGLWILSKETDYQSVIGKSALRCRNPLSVALKRLFYRIIPTLTWRNTILCCRKAQQGLDSSGLVL